MQAIRYSPEVRDAWNKMVQQCCNGTFLLDRRFMDYHEDRFQDASLLFMEKGKLKGLLPANIKGDIIQSHGGLTYGGLLHTANTSSEEVEKMLDAALDYYRNSVLAKTLEYRPSPYIYHTYPAEQSLYFLFRRGMTQTACMLSSTIDLHQPLPLSQLRKRCRKKAIQYGVTLHKACQEGQWKLFWKILSQVLLKRHGKQPVHSLTEILYLHNLFPDNIQLIYAENNGDMIAGTVLFITPCTIHTQYIAANEEGKSTGALDLIFTEIIHSSTNTPSSPKYLDFGISTEDKGNLLNYGLVFQKEGFGARGICYNHYQLQL